MSNNVSLELIKTLRDMTGAGMMDCKRALQEANGNLDAAIEDMRIKGQTKADKKAGRIAAEGLITIKSKPNGLFVAISEINCETDYAAKNEDFRSFAEKVTEIALDKQASTAEALLDLPYDAQTTIEEMRKNLVAKMGENVQIRRIAILNSEEKIAYYTHNGRIGAVVKTQGATDVLGKDLAMQIVATHPLTVEASEIPEALIAKEKEIFSEQAKASGKPANIIEKMIEGRIEKFKNEISLLGQPFVKDPSLTIQEILEKSNAKVISFIRFEVGEGIEKVTENFAEEVMKQAQAAQS
jgi:elongation factor Ts